MDTQQAIKEQRIFLIMNLVTLILLLILFQRVYSEASLINNEISFRNYIEEQNRIQLNQIETEIKTNERIKFPIYIYFLLGLTLIIIIEQMFRMGKYYKE